ncbi:hypothetical protein G9A89_014259 [Geosiphon pyriformis]|nr:hypothetical protein G9A89_014259 [Geosiphon pyriformis]
MLTQVEKEERIEWAKSYLNDNSKKPYFQMKQHFSCSQIQLKISKRENGQFGQDKKIVAWACIMDAKFYIEILQQHVGEINGILGRSALSAG